MSKLGNLLDKLTDVALGYTAVALVGAQSIVKSILPSKKTVVAPTVVERLPSKKPAEPKKIEFVEAELVDPKDLGTVDKQFEELHKENYEKFEKIYDGLTSKIKADKVEQAAKKHLIQWSDLLIKLQRRIESSIVL